ncbi:hypothetical protein L0156_20220 [bacterium]|nr:hypothetical protein [bacterium]
MKIVGLAVLITALFVTPLWSTTLRDVLKEHGFDYVPLMDLDLPILGQEISDTEDFFCVGYFIHGADPEIHVVLFDRRKLQWFETKLNLRESEYCFGSNAITGIQYSKNFVHLETHINPSAGCTLIFTKELQFRKALYGWPLAMFDDETVVYHNSEVHFAPTHPAAISLYNPVTKSAREIYPLKPYQRIRLGHIEKMRQLYSDEDWCREKNHHCDPESFDDSIGDLEINNETDSLIFQAQFSGDYWKDPEGSEVESLAVIYLYRHVRDPDRVEYREILEKDLKNRFGDHPLSEYLQPAILSRIFGFE